MELIFRRNPNTGSWVAEFEATADVALHIEGVDEGTVKIYQRGTSSGEYALTRGSAAYPSYGKVYDYEIPILIAPKFIKVVCRTEPTYAEVVSNGEITELKYQEKSVEVTANGNTEVIPDAGFAGLTKVNVSVNVPQSGGGEGGGSAFEYLDITNVTGMNGNLKTVLLQMAYMCKIPQTVKIGSVTLHQGISPVSFMSSTGFRPGMEEFTQVISAITAISIDFSTTINNQGQVLTIREALAMYGVQSDIDAIPRLTKEEFYNLNA